MMQNSLLVIGSKGQLGWELESQGADFGFSIIGIDVDKLDITDSAAVEATLKHMDVSVVINAAAYTAVDKAEAEPDLAFAVNREGPHNLAAACHQRSIPLIHISTDYVFNGHKRKPYEEENAPSPIGIYAQSKAQGEEAIQKQCEKHIIIRTAWLYGAHGNNFVKTMLRLGRERKELKVVNDQMGCPTSAEDLAAFILAICSQLHKRKDFNPWGIYHYCGQGETTWFGFAKKIFELASAYETLRIQRLIPITTAEYPTPAARPANSVLSCEKIERTFGVERRPWEKSLATMLERLYSD